MATGITKRHSKLCNSRDGGRCNCEPAYRAEVYSKRDGKKIRRTFTREAEAKGWRAEALSALSKGALRAPKPTTVRQAWDAWHEGARAGTIHNRSGEPYKPSVIRSYEKSMRLRVLPALAHARLTDASRIDVQEFVDGLVAAGLAASTVNVTLHPLRAIFRRALIRGELAANPCSGLELPVDRGRRERFASPAEAEALIAAVSVDDRATWATAFYAGLRQGELRALRVEDVDLAAGVIHVRRGWDRHEGEIELKSRSGRRRVPIVAVLRDHLLDHLARSGRRDSELIFGRTAWSPFAANRLQRHADLSWEAAGLRRITPHELRHSYAAMMIAAGVNAKALQTFMGHATITVTLDTYGHLMPGSEAEAAALAESYIAAQQERAEEAARAAGLHEDGVTGPPTGPRAPVHG
jgi:integrase